MQNKVKIHIIYKFTLSVISISYKEFKKKCNKAEFEKNVID